MLREKEDTRGGRMGERERVKKGMEMSDTDGKGGSTAAVEKHA